MFCSQDVSFFMYCSAVVKKTLDKPFCVYYFLENQHIRVYKKRYVLKEKFSNLTFWSDKTLKGIDNELN